MTYEYITVRNREGSTEYGGIPWTVRLVRPGDRFGRDDCLVHNDEMGLGPIVEFYDRRQDPAKFGPLGQFVSSYHRGTLFAHPLGRGLCLDAGIPCWQVDVNVMQIVKQWLAHTMEVE